MRGHGSAHVCCELQVRNRRLCELPLFRLRERDALAQTPARAKWRRDQRDGTRVLLDDHLGALTDLVQNSMKITGELSLRQVDRGHTLHDTCEKDTLRRPLIEE